MHQLQEIKDRTLYALIFIFAILLYVNTFGHGFIFDDVAVLSENEFVKSGIYGLKDIFTTGSWDGYNASAQMHIYRPLQLTVLALQFELFGLNPMGYHIVHVASYAVLCSLIFALLNNLFSGITHGRVIALVATLIYTAHPVHTEVVANIKGNGDLLAMLLGICSLLLIARHSSNKSIPALVGGTFVFLLAMLTKETIICFVGVAGLMLYCFSNLSLKRIAVTLLPMLMMVFIYLSIRSQVFGDNAQTLTKTDWLDNYILVADGASQQIGMRLYALGKNLQLCTIPYPLLFMYVYDAVPMVELFDIRALFSLAVHLVLGGVFLYNFRKGNIIGFATGYYFITLALFTNTVISIPNIFSERWLLMASLGTAVAMSYIVIKLYAHSPKSAICVFSLLMFGYAGYTVERAAVWKEGRTLYEADIKTAPYHSMTTRFLAKVYLKDAEEDPDNRVKNLKKAAFYQEIAVRLLPNHQDQREKLAKIYEQLEDYHLAASLYEIIVASNNPLKETALVAQARNLSKAGSHGLALPLWSKLMEKDPTSIETQAGYIAALSKTGSHEDAEARFAKLIESLTATPETAKGEKNYTALNNLGIALENMHIHLMAAKAFAHAANYNSPIRGKAAFSEAKNLNLGHYYSIALPRWQMLDKRYPNQLSVCIGKTIALIGTGSDTGTEMNRLVELLKSTTTSLRPEQSESINAIAIHAEKSKDYRLAADLFSFAAQYYSPIQGKAAYSQAKNISLSGDHQAALAAWKVVDKNYPNTISAIYNLAKAHEKLNQTAEALKHYRRVLELTSKMQDNSAYASLIQEVETKLSELK